MSNVLFPKGREGILDTTINMTGDVRAMLVKSTYVYNASDVFVSDMGEVDNGRTEALANKSYALGVFDAEDTSLVAMAAVATNAIVIYQHNADDGAARLIAYIDDPSSGLPCTPAAGQTINIKWDTGANKIFLL